jgi:Uma2 family endonuclease
MTQYAALARLLDLNNRVHDLQRELDQMPLPQGLAPENAWFEVVALNQVGRLQEEIDRETRASLVTAWLGMPPAEE